jgi:iron complex transport system permease protein
MGVLSMTVGAERHARRWIAVAAAIFCAAAALLPLAGPASLDLSRVWARQEPDWSIFVQLRVSRTLLGLFSGGAMALGGSIFQAMLRDGLATPDTLGISAGASLGAVAAIAMGAYVTAGISGIWFGAFCGAMTVLVVVVAAATRSRTMSAYGLLLAGVATNSVCWALVLLIHSLSGLSQSFAISRWLIGSLDAVAYRTLALFAGLVTAIAILVIRRAREWNLLAVGEAWAGTRGGDVRALLRFGYISGSLLSASTVTLTGPIAFISLVVPHMVRVRISADDRVLMPCAFLFGGVLLASCDALGRVILAPAEVPAGAITACIGGPYLMWLLRRRV